MKLAAVLRFGLFRQSPDMLMKPVQIRVVFKKHVNHAALRVDGFVLLDHQLGQKKVRDHKQYDQQWERGQLAFTFSGRVRDGIHFFSPQGALVPSVAVVKADFAPNVTAIVYCSRLKT